MVWVVWVFNIICSRNRSSFFVVKDVCCVAGGISTHLNTGAKIFVSQISDEKNSRWALYNIYQRTIDKNGATREKLGQVCSIKPIS